MELADDDAKLRALPAAWTFDSIGNLFDIRQGKSLARHKQTGKQKNKFLRTANVLWGKLDLSQVDEMDFSPAECETLALKSGDLLVCEGGDIGRTAVWRDELADCYYQNHLHRLRVRDGRVNPEFVMFWMQAAITQLRVYEGFGNKTTIPNLSRSRLSDFVIPVPEKSEQEKIAAVLWKIQKAIEIEDAIVRNARDLKKSLLRHLFTHGLRGEPLKETEIGPLPQSWDVLPLRELVVARGGFPFPHAKQGNKSGAFPFYKVSDMNLAGNERYMSDSSNWIDDSVLFELKAKTFSSSTVIFPKVGGALLTNKKRMLTRASVIDNNLMGVTVKNERELLSSFLFQWFYTVDLAELSNPGPLPSINAGRLYETRFPLAKLDEQREIADILQTVDRKIDIHEAKKRSLQELFKTMLHKLMTAQIRVNDLDIDTSEVRQ